MRPGILLIIFRKEMLDTLRDRRTLISMVIVPLLVIPLMMTVMSTVIRQAEKRAAQEATSAGVPLSGLPPEYLETIRKAGLTPKPVADLRAAVLAKTVPVGVEVSKSSKGETEVHVYVDRSNEVSGAAGDKVRTALTELRDAIVQRKLREAGVASDILNPFLIRRENIAGERKMAGALWGRILGYVVILLMFTGGMYPAIDMTAGEKERRTLETLLSSPASRHEIVLAKILTCVAANLVTAALSLASLAVSVKRGGFGGSRELQQMLNIPLDASSLGLLMLTLLPVAVFAASTMIAIAIFARSFKEGQSYLTPLVFMVILPALMGGMSGFELSPLLAMIPVFNASQLIRAIMSGDFPAQAFLLTMAANLVYGAIAFWIAVRLFEDESVLFRS